MADLSDYWETHPPVQWMVQAYLGIKTEKPKELTPDEFRAMVQAM